MIISKKDTAVDFSKKKFLIVEDFISFRSLLKKMLLSFAVSDVDEAGNGEEAVRKLSLKRYDIILCDYNLGVGKDGQQVLEEAKLRGYIGYSTIFMMITAENTVEMFMGALEYQPDDYLMKPFNKSMLEKKLESLYRKKENLGEIERAIDQGDYARAIGICSRLIEKNPRNLPELLKLKGEMLLKTEAYDRAAEFYDKVLSMGNFPWAVLGLGKVKFTKGDYQGAKRIFEELIENNDKITSAYDWLAKTLEKMGDLHEAQQTLMKAVAISPKAILRQKELGTIARQNKDYTTAEHSLRAVIKQGKNSYLKSSSDYTGLANVLMNLNDGAGSVEILNEAAAEFPGDAKALLDITITRSRAYKMANNEEGSKRALETAVKLAESSAEHLSRDMELELVKACFLAGDEKTGAKLVRNIVQNSHDDEALAEQVRGAFRDIGMEEAGFTIIENAREEVYNLNNEGVRLVREGDLDKAVAYFEEAGEKLKENKIINANAALALILHMKKHGHNDQYNNKVQVYLERVRGIDPAYKDLAQLQAMFAELKPKFKSAWRVQVE